MAVVNDTDNNGSPKIAKIAKAYANRKVAKFGFKISAKVIKIIVSVFTTLLGTIFVPIICVMLITVMVVNLFGQVYNVEQYKQECPELVNYFLQDNFDKFEEKVSSYVHDPEFVSFVCDSEFDNGYTKLVYGGTSAYTQEELEGNYKGVQGQKAKWVTYDKNKNKYYAKSVLNTIQDYIDKGVNVNNIKINDEYLKGYGNASGYGKRDSMDFTKWINNSYYTIPFYYHFNMAKNSEYVYPSSFIGYVYKGTKGGLPNWFEEMNTGSWNFMQYATIDGKSKSNDGIAGYPSYDRQIWNKNGKGKMSYSKITYKDYLKTGWMSFKPNSVNAGNIPSNSQLEKEYKNGQAYYAKGVMLGYKMYIVNSWFEKALNTLFDKDESYDYSPFSRYFTFGQSKKYTSKYDKAVDDLYVYNWFNKKTGSKSNYNQYIMNVRDVNTVSQRENAASNSIVNSNVEMWLDNFAEYFAKEIYYVYPNRQYIVDYFLNDDNSEKGKHKKIAFLQRSFYAMATGSSLDFTVDEEYKLDGGNVTSSMTENNVGTLNIKNISLEKISYSKYIDKTGEHGVSNYNGLKTLMDETLKYWQAVYIGNDDMADKTYDCDIIYKAKIRIKYSNGNKEQCVYVPIKNTLLMDLDGNILSNQVTFNPKGFKSSITKKNNEKLKKYIAFSWDKTYKESQVTYDNEGTIKNKNPLDSINVKEELELSEYSEKKWDVTCMDVQADSLKQSVNNYCNQQVKQSSVNPIAHLLDGKFKGNRKIDFKFSDHSFLNYQVEEKKDSNGKVTGVIIEIYTYYPDLTKYGDGEYRVAYGFESTGALQEALHLLQYTQDNSDKQIGGKNAGQPLSDLASKVDFSKLLIGEDDGSYVDSGGIYSDDDVYSYIATILAQVESSNNWGAVAKPYANTAGEKTITVGAYQFYGENAHALLKLICTKYKKNALGIISKDLFFEVMSNKNWESIGWKPHSESDYTSISKLIKTDEGIECQKELMAKRAKSYVESAIKFKLTDIKLQVYYAVMYHQSPKRAIEVVKSLSGQVITLDSLHKMRSNNSVLCNYVNRYNTTYEFCKKITNMKTIKGDLKGVMQYAQSDRVIGKSYSNNRSDFLGSNGLPSTKKYKATYDCSEFVACCFYYGMGFDFGKNYTAASMEAYLDKNNYKVVCSGSVDTKKLKAGDVMFFNSQNGYNKGAHGIGHVAIYFGDGKCVEAGNPVGIYNVAGRSGLYRAYRIIKK